MANSYFKFKQFTIFQEHCAMKVCQDSCAFGAWADPVGANSILDIGTGTGLLSLMLAQRTAAEITAIEIDAKAVRQAEANVAASPFSQQIKVLKVPLNAFSLDARKRFDIIICNPPFYQQHLTPGHSAKKLAHHDDGTFFGELVTAAMALLETQGTIMLMYPPWQSLQFEKFAAAVDLILQHRTVVFDRPGKAAIRHFDRYSFAKATETTTDGLYFKDADSQLSGQFKELMKDYYLDK